ncbi:MAG: small basic family protein [Clostridia bacterium]|nr:small basic family protein [Clostridia bacterium]
MIVLFCALTGIAVGLVFPYHIPSAYSQYVAIVILALLDSIFGAAVASTRKSFDLNTFISGFICNGLLAAVLTLIGKKLDVDLYLVALIVFGTRLFSNFSAIRRHYLPEILTKLKKKFGN